MTSEEFLPLTEACPKRIFIRLYIFIYLRNTSDRVSIYRGFPIDNLKTHGSLPEHMQKPSEDLVSLMLIVVFQKIQLIGLCAPTEICGRPARGLLTTQAAFYLPISRGIAERLQLFLLLLQKTSYL